ncbi:hypothetical protein GEMRC1_002955 [Eukaryota sp. GEM-RC1]
MFSPCSSIFDGIVSIVGSGGKTSLMFSLARFLHNRSIPVYLSTTTKLAPPTINSFNTIGCSNTGNLLSCMSTLTTPLLFFSHLVQKNGGLRLVGHDYTVIHTLKPPNGVLLLEADGSRGKPLKCPNLTDPCISPSSNVVIFVIGAEVINSKLGEDLVFRSLMFASILDIAPESVLTPELLVDYIIHPRGGKKDVPLGCNFTVVINKIDLNYDGALVLGNLLSKNDQVDSVVLTCLDKFTTESDDWYSQVK